VPKGSPQHVDLDEAIFRLTSHWDDHTAKLLTLAKNRSNVSSFTIRVNQQIFHASDHGEGAHPLLITMHCPDGEERWISWFWMDEDGICQVNSGAPAPDPKAVSGHRTWSMPLYCPHGEVLILATASKDKEALDFTELDMAFAEKVISKNKIKGHKDRDEIGRLEAMVRLMEMRASSLVFATVRFTVKP